MRSRIAGAALVLTLSATGVAAQTTSETGTATLVVTEVLHIQVDGLDVNFPFDPAQFASTPYYIAGDVSSTVRHRGNVTHSVVLRADDDVFAGASGARADKSAGDLEVRLQPFGGAFGAFAPISDASDFAVVTSQAAGDYMTTPATVGYRVRVDATDTPGTYTLSFTYTIIAG